MAKKNTAAATSRQSAAPPVEYASAMDKLRDEMAKSKDNYTRVVGEYLTGYLLAHPEAEAALLAKGKSIKGSLEAVRKEAEKVKTGNVAVLDDQTVFGIVLGYFGIEAEADVLKTGENVIHTGENVLKTGENVLKTGDDVLKTGENVTAAATGEATSSDPPQAAAHLPLKGKASGETGKAAAPDPFDLDALLGVM